MKNCIHFWNILLIFAFESFKHLLICLTNLQWAKGLDKHTCHACGMLGKQLLAWYGMAAVGPIKCHVSRVPCPCFWPSRAWPHLWHYCVATSWPLTACQNKQRATQGHRMGWYGEYEQRDQESPACCLPLVQTAARKVTATER